MKVFTLEFQINCNEQIQKSVYKYAQPLYDISKCENNPKCPLMGEW